MPNSLYHCGPTSFRGAETFITFWNSYHIYFGYVPLVEEETRKGNMSA